VNRTSLRRTLVPAASIAALALALSACGGNSNASTDGDGSNGATGSISIDGSSTVGPMSKVAAELFNEDNPDVKITVGESGTGGGFEKFCAAETDMNDASRPIEDDESTICGDAGIEYQEMIVGNDALTVVVNKENTWASCLTVDQLKKIWEPKSKLTNWNQVDASFPDEKLDLYGPGTDSGTFDYFTDAVNGEEGASRTDYTPSENDNTIVQGVQGSKGGLGYFGYSYFEQNSDTLTAVEIDGGDGCVAPSAATVADGTYTPLARPLFIYPSVTNAKDNSALATFVDYYVTNAAKIADAAQFIPLNDEQAATLDSELSDFQSAIGAS
jgi:phosphate transport system substrate-binding protein